MPAALEGRDILGLAATGTGKTAAFVLPILQRLLARKAPGPRALVVAPTRELAAQIHTEFETLAKYTGLRTVPVFGGVPTPRQVRALSSRPDVVVACPGRLLDLLQQRALRLDGVETLVLDEADHMFDMGFLPDLRRILKALPQRRQNLLFSATMPREIRKLADEVLDRPHVVELGHSAPPSAIEHVLFTLPQERKLDLLRHLLAEDDFTSGIVFLRTKHRARRLAEQLSHMGHAAIALQGNMSQGQRVRAMEGFRRGEYDVLVATDIAARGIDVANVSHVVNFDVPNTPDAYTHRIGRTGRSEMSGKAYTFGTHEDRAAIRDIERRLGEPVPTRPLPALEEGPEVRWSGRGRSSGAATGRRSTAARPSAQRAKHKGTKGSRRRARAAERSANAGSTTSRSAPTRFGSSPLRGRAAEAKSSKPAQPFGAGAVAPPVSGGARPGSRGRRRTTRVAG